MDSCFKVYLDTTNPEASYSSLFSTNVLLSILFHSVAYVLIINGILLLFDKKVIAFEFLFLGVEEYTIQGSLWAERNWSILHG